MHWTRSAALAALGALAAGAALGGEKPLVTPEEAARAKAALRGRIIAAGSAGKRPSFYVDFGGRATRARLVRADDGGVTARVSGTPMELPWKGLSARRFHGLAAKCVDERSFDDQLTLARFALGSGLNEEAEAALRRALELDPKSAEARKLLDAVSAPAARPGPRRPLIPSSGIASRPAAGPGSKPKRRATSVPKVGRWEPVGFSGGGAMFTCVISRADPDMMFINCDMSAAYVSTDGGRFWRMIHHRQLRGNTRCKPAFHPTDPNTIYAPSGWGGRALAVSRDKGVTWQKLADVPGGLNALILIDPDNPAVMIAGTQNGATISRNGGKSWKSVPGLSGGAIAFHFDRTSPATVFAAASGGVYRSDDAGATWTEKTSGLPWKKVLAFAGGSNAETKQAVLYVSVESRNQGGKFAGGIYRSTDKGESWQQAMGKGINLATKQEDQWSQGPIAQYRFLLTTDVKPMTVYSLNSSTGFWPPGHKTVYRSDDGGRTWRDTLFLDPRFPKYNVVPNYQTAATGQSYMPSANSAAIAPTDPGRILWVTGMPGFLTHDGGKSWFNAHCSPAPGMKPAPGTPFVCNGLVVTSTWNYYVDPFQHRRHYIAYTDIGFGRSLDGGSTWIWWEKGKQAPWRNTCYELAFDPEIPGKAWGAFSNVHDIPNGNIISGRHRSEGPGGVCISTDFCESWRPSNQSLPVAPCTSVVVDPKSPRGARVLYAGVFDKGVYKSTDDGKTWTKKSSGLGHPSNMRVYRVVLHADGTLYALITAKRTGGGYTSNGVGLWRSTDKAESWELILKDPVLKWPKDFSVHPENSKVIFLGAADAGDQSGGLYRSTDGGSSWKRVARKSRQHFGAFFHPKRPNWIYLTTAEGTMEHSLWLSTDGGSTWKPFEDFPFTNTQRVTVDPDDDNLIYVTTFGGSVFRGPAAP